ncbi:hypothetical protein AbraIFM66951_008175 [Aspergillus brasiliensis]|uniref:Zn(II)2Cys6 transcription factor n=1 Tax=Aspergillus brasiliensis TaxID=319629 RepID=A0A9W6DLS0_9EURO|nr:hypothetical protein AbraCBS73388_005282 [Aspergillus brasiliensis]GKZ45522.1 hypothetical protein AbraIFM66951_008175 [Aspergillus brasiliensis]
MGQSAFRPVNGTIAEIAAVIFVQVKDPFADDEEPILLEKHRSIASTPVTTVTEPGVIPSSTHSPAPPADNGVLTALLVRHFKEGPSQWLDCFDTNAYYSIKVPVMVATRPMLRVAACALAAKHLHRMCQGDSHRILQLPHLRSSALQWAIGGIDLKYESVRLYDEAIRYLKEAIRLDIPNHRREEMFAVVAILCQFELIDAPSTEWRAHLSALPFLYCGTSDEMSLTSSLPNSLLHISRSVFWSLVRQDVLSAFINETQTRLDLFDLVIWRNFGLNISSHGHFVPPSISSSTVNTPILSSPSPHAPVPPHCTWLDEDTLSNALIWIMGKIINFITSGDGIYPGDYESPPGQRPCFGTTQEDLLERWKRLEFELSAWYDTLPDSFTPCGRTRLFLSNLEPTHSKPVPTSTEQATDVDTIDAIIFTIPMCAVTIQTYHMGRILLLSNMPQESTAIRSTVTARLRHYRQIAGLVIHHAREICGISLAGLPDAILSHTVQPLFVAGQCFEGDEERRLVVDLLRRVESDTGWATEYRVKDLQRQWADGGLRCAR